MKKDEIKLKRIIDELGNYRGRHTELISVYIPDGYDLHKKRNQLADEQGTAQNIKSKSTRLNVIAALEKLQAELKNLKKTPKNGLILFCGNVSEDEGKTDIKIWFIIPPEPNKVNLYRCDQTFILEPLVDMFTEKESYGLLVMDVKEATIGMLVGKRVKTIKKLSSTVPGKIRAGGQSANRFRNIREGLKKEFLKEIATAMNETFIEEKDLKGVLIGGPGPIKDEFLNMNLLRQEIKKKVIGVKDIAYTDESGLEEMVSTSQDLIKNEEMNEEKEIFNKFLGELSKDLGVYGKEEIKKALEIGSVKIVILSECLDISEIDEISELAEKVGAEVKIISTETREGKQLKDIGKFAAILRYKTTY